MRNLTSLLARLLILAFVATPAFAMDMSTGTSMGGAPKPPPVAAGHALGGPFTLIDQNGRAVTQADYPGAKIVYFGYTTCPDACPLDLRRIDAALHLLPASVAPPPVLFISTDPERDTPAKLKAFLKSFQPPVTGLTGTSAEIARLEKAYGVYAEKAWNKDHTDYMVNHTIYIYVVDANNAVIDVFGNEVDAKALAAGFAKDLKP